MLEMLRRLVVNHRHPTLLVAVGALSFIGVWVLAGLALIAGDAGLHACTERREQRRIVQLTRRGFIGSHRRETGDRRRQHVNAARADCDPLAHGDALALSA